MQVMQQSEVSAVSGGGKVDPVGVPSSSLGDRPVPIWRPIFPVDP